jgi:hypothetical protein
MAAFAATDPSGSAIQERISALVPEVTELEPRA